MNGLVGAEFDALLHTHFPPVHGWVCPCARDNVPQ